MIDLNGIELISFDCYGTLIDWESGILAALRPILDDHDVQAGNERVLELYAAAESSIEAGPYLPYRDVLARVVQQIGQRLGFEPSAGQCASLAESVGDWPPFPDTIEALGRLHGHAKLAIISNVDDDLFARTAARLETDFDCVITAQQIGSYKPSPRNFELARERFVRDFHVGQAGWLHAAQSLFHDITPARRLGIQTAWVNRRAGRNGGGATPSTEATPDLAVPDLRTLADHFGSAL